MRNAITIAPSQSTNVALNRYFIAAAPLVLTAWVWVSLFLAMLGRETCR